MKPLRNKQPELVPSGDGSGEVDAVLDDSKMRRAGDILPDGRCGPACNVHDLDVINVFHLPADMVRFSVHSNLTQRMIVKMLLLY